MNFGEKLQRLRKARGWTQEQLAEQMGVSRQSLSKWESDAALPDTANVVLLSQLFGVTTDYLLTDSNASAEGAPAASQASASPAPAKSPPTPKPHLTLGSILAVLGLLVWLPLRIMAIVNPMELHIMDGPQKGVYTGIQGFVRYHDLELPYYASLILLVVGMVVILVPFLLQWAYNYREKKRKEAPQETQEE